MRTEPGVPDTTAAWANEAEPDAAHKPRPPDVVVWGIVCGYGLALLALAFLPGATLIERLRALDGGICSQLPGHSFFPGGQQLPLCSRNTGIYTGFVATVGVLAATGRLRASRLPSLGAGLVLLAAAGFMALDGFNSLFRDLHLPYLYEPHNLLRLATGLGMGTAMAAFIVPITNGLLWKVELAVPSFGSVGQLGLMLPVLTVVWVAVVSQAAFLLYPIALVESAGLLCALTLVNLVFALGLTGRVGVFARWRELLPYFAGATVLAVVELMALFVLRQHLMQALPA